MIRLTFSYGTEWTKVENEETQMIIWTREDWKAEKGQKGCNKDSHKVVWSAYLGDDVTSDKNDGIISRLSTQIIWYLLDGF